MLGKYESMVIFSPNLSNEELETESNKITDLVAELGGEVTKTDNWGKKQLAYEIMKFREGYYIVYNFELNTLKVNLVDRHYRLTERIIRHNIIKLDAKEEEE